MDFLNHLPEHIPEDTILASFDVESLYSNIPHDLGLDAIKFWLQKHPEDLHRRFTDNFILDSIEFILQNNTFYFNAYMVNTIDNEREQRWGQNLPLSMRH